jgi:hypothetical protein
MTPDIAISNSSSRLSVIARAVSRLPQKARPSRAAYMRTYRTARRAQELGTQAGFVGTRTGRGAVALASCETANDNVVCRLCLESFETGVAYSNHFKERRFPEGADGYPSFDRADVHVCYSRQEMRDLANLTTNWETGAWRVRR